MGQWELRTHRSKVCSSGAYLLFLRAVFSQKEGSIPTHTEVASGVLWNVSTLICCPVSTIFAFFFCSSGSSQWGRIADHSYNFISGFWFFLLFWKSKGEKWWWTNSLKYPVEQSCVPATCISYVCFYGHQNMKHCWGNTRGNTFNTGGDIETPARLRIMQGGLPKSVSVFALWRCKWCIQLLPFSGFSI